MCGGTVTKCHKVMLLLECWNILLLIPDDEVVMRFSVIIFLLC